ncbi:acetoacetyl-CoA synthase [Ascosphaera apis ARSEF 7405]|uniref:Acetoacetyl-CoA synthase n=1 Tax=Ascosphaera apis ARSEF 7405 TaxID=392613 RepID=A0A168AGS6_9EURO|nr:acetoacetyl-CoA synthase [Ascosphaera apis ARSEF 7405]
MTSHQQVVGATAAAKTVTNAAPATPLWTPSAPEKTSIHEFIKIVERKHSLTFTDYHDLWKWSIEKPDIFWEEVYHFTHVKTRKSYDLVIHQSVLHHLAIYTSSNAIYIKRH